MRANREHLPFSAEYSIGPAARVRVCRNLNGQLRMEFVGDNVPAYMNKVIFEARSNQAVELDTETRTFWRLKGVGPPPWLAMPSTRLAKTSLSEIFFGVRCTLYRLTGADGVRHSETWVADDLGMAVRETQVLDGREQVTLELSSLTIGDPDPELFVIPEGYQESKEQREWEEVSEE